MELNGTQEERLARSQSSGSVWKGSLWVVGGHSLDLSLPLTVAFNISGNFHCDMQILVNFYHFNNLASFR